MKTLDAPDRLRGSHQRKLTDADTLVDVTVRKVSDRQPPTGVMRLMLRAPVWLYRAGLGGLLGRRLLMLSHRGRVSGELRRTVLEVAGHDPATGAWLVASGFGSRSQWLRNIDAHPDVQVRCGWHREVNAVAHRLPPPAAGAAMVNYARRHPRAARSLMRMCGLLVDGSTKDYQVVGEQYLPFVSLTPR